MNNVGNWFVIDWLGWVNKFIIKCIESLTYSLCIYDLKKLVVGKKNKLNTQKCEILLLLKWGFNGY